MVYKMVFPWSKRRAMWWIIFQIVISPFGRLTFPELYFADVMTSFNKISASAAQAGCYIFSGDYFVDHKPGAPPPGSAVSPSCGSVSITQRYITPMVIFCPLWFKLLQCLRQYYNTQSRWPYIPNSIKYGFGMTVVLFGIFNPFYLRPGIDSKHRGLIVYHSLWVISYVTTTLFTWVWDVKMDWDLFSMAPKKKGDYRYPLLRGRLLFRHHIWVYYVAIVSNLVLRFLWTLSLLPTATTGPLAYIQSRYSDFLPGVELFRRFMCSCFRLEAQQIRRDEAMFQDQERHYLYPSDREEECRSQPAVFSRTRAEQALRLEQIRDGVDGLTLLGRGKRQAMRRRRRSGGKDGGDGGGGLKDDRHRAEEEEPDVPELFPSVSSFISSTDGETDDEADEEEEEEEALESQKAMQKEAASRRSTIIEVVVILCFFISVAALASKKWVH